ncbi:hypothetical protein [Nocardia sp. NPDC058666]|uniref:hypothetical protein n=1 Tax=unclassified Nocardia TaxID=2637762 RepID=UPI00364CB00E
MEPLLAVVVTAISVGAKAGLTASAQGAVADAYTNLKQLIDRRYNVDLDPVEGNPGAIEVRDRLAEDLSAAGAGGDRQLLEVARALIDATDEHGLGGAVEELLASADSQEAREFVAVRIKRVYAESLRICGVDSAGAGVRVSEASFVGAIDISDVKVGRSPVPFVVRP